MASSTDLLANVLQLENRTGRTGTAIASIDDVVAALQVYARTLAQEKGLVFTDASTAGYRDALARYSVGALQYSTLNQARDAYLNTALGAGSAPRPSPIGVPGTFKPLPVGRAAIVKQRLDAAIAAKAPQATIDALKAEYEKQLALQTQAAQKALDVGVAAGANPNVVSDLRKQLVTAQSQEASGKLAASPARELLTFAVMTSPAWLTLLMLRYRII